MTFAPIQLGWRHPERTWRDDYSFDKLWRRAMRMLFCSPQYIQWKTSTSRKRRISCHVPLHVWRLFLLRVLWLWMFFTYESMIDAPVINLSVTSTTRVFHRWLESRTGDSQGIWTYFSLHIRWSSKMRQISIVQFFGDLSRFQSARRSAGQMISTESFRFTDGTLRG